MRWRPHLSALHAAPGFIRAAVTWGLVLAASLAAPGLRAAGIEVTDDLGRQVHLPAPPQRIVTLGPALTETVCALQACERLVGVDRFSDHPARVRQLPQLGSLGETSVEQVLSLRPDLVLLTPAARLHERLAQLGLKVVALDAQSLPEVARQLRKVAQALGVPAQAETVWREIEQGLAAGQAALPPRWAGARVYVEVDPTPFAAGEASFMGQLLTGLGLRNTVPGALGTFPKINPELVLQHPPDLIIASPRSAASLTTRPGWGQLSALRQGRVCTLREDDDRVLGRPGPRIVQAQAVLLRCLRDTPPPALTRADPR